MRPIRLINDSQKHLSCWIFLGSKKNFDDSIHFFVQAMKASREIFDEDILVDDEIVQSGRAFDFTPDMEYIWKNKIEKSDVETLEAKKNFIEANYPRIFEVLRHADILNAVFIGLHSTESFELLAESDTHYMLISSDYIGY